MWIDPDSMLLHGLPDGDAMPADEYEAATKAKGWPPCPHCGWVVTIKALGGAEAFGELAMVFVDPLARCANPACPSRQGRRV